MLGSALYYITLTNMIIFSTICAHLELLLLERWNMGKVMDRFPGMVMFNSGLWGRGRVSTV